MVVQSGNIDADHRKMKNADNGSGLKDTLGSGMVFENQKFQERCGHVFKRLGNGEGWLCVESARLYCILRYTTFQEKTLRCVSVDLHTYLWSSLVQ